MQQTDMKRRKILNTVIGITLALGVLTSVFANEIFTYARMNSGKTESDSAKVASFCVNIENAGSGNVSILNPASASLSIYQADIKSYEGNSLSPSRVNEARCRIDITYKIVTGAFPLTGISGGTYDSSTESYVARITNFQSDTEQIVSRSCELNAQWSASDRDYRYADEIDYCEITINATQID